MAEVDAVFGPNHGKIAAGVNRHCRVACVAANDGLDVDDTACGGVGIKGPRPDDAARATVVPGDDETPIGGKCDVRGVLSAISHGIDVEDIAVGRAISFEASGEHTIAIAWPLAAPCDDEIARRVHRHAGGFLVAGGGGGVSLGDAKLRTDYGAGGVEEAGIDVLSTHLRADPGDYEQATAIACDIG